VWEDSNRNGQHESSERPLAGAIIQIEEACLLCASKPGAAPLGGRSQSQSAQRVICTTDATGICRFLDLPPGTYWVTEVNPRARFSTTPDRVSVQVVGEQTQYVRFGDAAYRVYLPLLAK